MIRTAWTLSAIMSVPGVPLGVLARIWSEVSCSF
jgi:hypothetical protein